MEQEFTMHIFPY